MVNFISPMIDSQSKLCPNGKFTFWAVSPYTKKAELILDRKIETMNFLWCAHFVLMRLIVDLWNFWLSFSSKNERTLKSSKILATFSKICILHLDPIILGEVRQNRAKTLGKSRQISRWNMAPWPFRTLEVRGGTERRHLFPKIRDKWGSLLQK